MFMICPPFFRSPSIWPKAQLLVMLLLGSGCSVFSGAPEPTSKIHHEQGMSPTREKTHKRVRLGQFEWAVQSYEAGEYLRAIQQFRVLEKAGSKLADYEMVPFYIGMSYFQLGRNKEAATHLERFLQLDGSRREAQDARLALLLIYERLREWSRLLGLAVETEGKTLFQNNRALTKLVWARALIETGELLGARTQLKDAAQYLDLSGGEDRNTLTEAEKDVWGRYHFTSLLVLERECAAMDPKEVGDGKKKRLLYTNWLEALADCVKSSIVEASSELFLKDSAWSNLGFSALEREVDGMATKIRAHLKTEGKVISRRQALEKNVRQSLYRILSELDKQIKSFKDRELNSQYLESIRKKIDLLLVSLSSPS